MFDNPQVLAMGYDQAALSMRVSMAVLNRDIKHHGISQRNEAW